ncbi:MAG: NifU family protein [Gemmatimonadota bacterium]|nr:NifU family protein [Gemmatimonadota bacterium]
MTDSISIRSEELEDGRYRFHVNGTVHNLGPGLFRFDSVADAKGIPAAEAVLGIPHITEVVLAEDSVTVSKSPPAEWSDLEAQVEYALQQSVTANSPVDSFGPVNDDDLYDAVTEFFRVEVAPSVAQHGGAVELIDVEDGIVMVRMQGGCQGCGMASVTLKQGIEAGLKRTFPQIKAVQDITDHAAGSNPYFQQSKK